MATEHVEIRLTYDANTPSGKEVVTYGNMSNASDMVRRLCQANILPKVELEFGDGTIKEVSASCMC